jgi:hypothetical protein
VSRRRGAPCRAAHVAHRHAWPPLPLTAPRLPPALPFLFPSELSRKLRSVAVELVNRLEKLERPPGGLGREGRGGRGGAWAPFGCACAWVQVVRVAAGRKARAVRVVRAGVGPAWV